MVSIQKLLSERGKRYGEFWEVAVAYDSLRESINVDHLPSTHRVAIDMIFLKVARIICGDYNYKDNWDDIAGYATLVSNILKEGE